MKPLYTVSNPNSEYQSFAIAFLPSLPFRTFVEDNNKRYEGMILNDPKHKQKENPKEEVER